jgi:arsenate reductase (thioredoxin)
LRVSASEQDSYGIDERPNKGVTPIIFVGGTGRSGTHVVSRLLGRHKALAAIGVECRFHTDSDGFPGLLDGSVTQEAFLRKLRGFWWKGKMSGRERGLFRFVPEEVFDEAVESFQRDFDPSAPETACRGLFLDLLWSHAAGKGASGLVEQSCDNVAQAATLLRLFPEAKFVHVVRDGRDASSSRVSQSRGRVYPRTRKQGIEWFEERIRGIEAGARLIPDDRLMQVSLEDVLTPPRHEAAREVANFAGVRFGRRMRRFFFGKMGHFQANTERWREGISKRKQRAIEKRYVEMLERLEADGVSSAPILRNEYQKRIEAPPVIEKPPPQVLFVCIHNAGRSQMAAAFVKQLANDRLRARSAGSDPADEVNPVVVEAMREVGIDLSEKSPRLLKTANVEKADAIVTMGCGDACPVLPGKRYEDWELEDPAGKDLETVRRIRDEIEERVRMLTAKLAAQPDADSDADAAAASRPSGVVTS